MSKRGWDWPPMKILDVLVDPFAVSSFYIILNV